MSPPQRQRTGTAAVTAAFLLSTAGSGLFAWLYTIDAGVQALGVSAALALAALGVGLAVWSKRLMPHGPWEEQRDKLELGREEEREAAATFEAGMERVGRRGLLGGLLAAAAGSLGIGAAFTVRSLGPRPDVGLRNTGWAPGVRLVDQDGRPVAVGDLEVGGILTVFPEGRSPRADDQVLLARVNPANLQPLPGREDWSPGGHLAYSKVCTHAGCPVGMFQPNAHLLLCPCHQATFDILEGGRTVFGPAPRPLPQLPLDVEEGFLVARSDFPEPIGPDRWRIG